MDRKDSDNPTNESTPAVTPGQGMPAHIQKPAGQPITVGETTKPKPRPILDPTERFAEQLKTLDEALAEADTLEEKLIAACKAVHDPEIPVNIYELGLIYDLAVDDKKNVTVTMTLTSPACPAAQELPLEVKRNIVRIAEVNDCEVDITFDPPWSPEKMSDVAKLTLGFM